MIPDTLSVKMLPEENEGGSLAQKGMPVEAPIDRYYRPGFLFPVPSEGNPCSSDKRDDGHSFGSSSFRARYSRVFIRRLLLPSIRWRSIEQGWPFDRVTSVSMAEGKGKDEGRPMRRRREAAIVRREANKFPGQRRIKRAILLSRLGPKAPRQFHGLFHGRPSLIFHPLWKPGNPCTILTDDSTEVAPKIVKTAPPPRGHARIPTLLVDEQDPSWSTWPGERVSRG